MRRTCLKTSQSPSKIFQSCVLPEGSLLHPLYFYLSKSNSVRSPVLQLVNIHFNFILSDDLFFSGFPTNILYTVPIVELTLR